MDEIPTLERIRECLNDLLKKEKIDAKSEFLNKKKIKKYKALTQQAFKTNSNLKQTIIQIRYLFWHFIINFSI